MKKVLGVALLVISFIGLSLPVTAQGQGINFSARFGGMLPTNGEFTSAGSLSDEFDLGLMYGAQVGLNLMPSFAVVAGYDFASLPMSVVPTTGAVPKLSIPHFFVKGHYNFTSLIKNPLNRIKPYLSFGGGLYSWKVTADGGSGNQVFGNGTQLKKTSFGLNFGPGFELSLSNSVSLFAEGTYHLVFAKDNSFSGSVTPGNFSVVSGLDNFGFFAINGGLTFSLPMMK